MAMTTPVFTSSGGKMQFVVGTKQVTAPENSRSIFDNSSTERFCSRQLYLRSSCVIQAPCLQGEPPLPESDAVRTRIMPGGLFAAYPFNGAADEAVAKDKLVALRAALSRDRVGYEDAAEWILARYNDPSTRPIFRHNEVIIPVSKFDMWDYL